MTVEKSLLDLEVESVLAEKRDKLNGRLQVWSLLIGLVGAFGLASVQSGETVYIVALFPLFASCLARYVGHAEAVLDQVKAYLFEIETELHGTSAQWGYEHWIRAHKSSRPVGSHMKAFRDVIVLLDGASAFVVSVRLMGQWWFLGVVVVLVGVNIGLTWYWLRHRKAVQAA